MIRGLESLVAAGTFREDLYYRLNVIRVDVPPLRQRKEDIGDLSSAFLKRHADSLLDEPKVLSPEASGESTFGSSNNESACLFKKAEDRSPISSFLCLSGGTSTLITLSL